METQTREEKQPSSSAMLSSLDSSLTGDVIQLVDVKPEDPRTVRFVFNSWMNLLNINASGFKHGVRYLELQRMKALPIRTWPVAVFRPRPPRGGGIFGLAALSNATEHLGGGFTPGADNTVRNRSRLQYPNESVSRLISAHGGDNLNSVGLVELKSLAAIEDAEKVESILLFRAVMETPLDGATPGNERLLEHLPEFLATEARELLMRAITDGLQLKGTKFKFSKEAGAKGTSMIKDIGESVTFAHKRALSKKTGVLEVTKTQMAAWKAGDKVQGKINLDERDEFLLAQFPSYSMDTEVERAGRASAGVAAAIADSANSQNDVLMQMVKNQELMAQQIQQQAETTNRLLEIIAADRAAAAKTESVQAVT